MLNSGYFITILHKNSGKLSTAPAPRKASAPYAYMQVLGNINNSIDEGLSLERTFLFKG
jgi:hypothetical protein